MCTRWRHERREFGDELHRLKLDVRRAVLPRRLELVAHRALRPAALELQDHSRFRSPRRPSKPLGVPCAYSGKTSEGPRGLFATLRYEQQNGALRFCTVVVPTPLRGTGRWLDTDCRVAPPAFTFLFRRSNGRSRNCILVDRHVRAWVTRVLQRIPVPSQESTHRGAVLKRADG